MTLTKAMKTCLIVALLAISMVKSHPVDSFEHFIGTNGQFTADIYKELSKGEEDNSFAVSPLSAEIVLALVHSGAGGKTAQELSTALHLSENKDHIHKIFNELSPHLQGDQYHNLSSANKVYVKNGLKIHDDFKKVAEDVFDAEIENIDFSKAKEAIEEMNQWVEGKTHHYIKKLIAASDVDDSTMSVLINALYFSGSWTKKFNKEATKTSASDVDNSTMSVLINALYFSGSWTEGFNKKATKTSAFHAIHKDVDVDMMSDTDIYQYHDSEKYNAKFLKVPCMARKDVGVTFVLPNRRYGLSALEEHIHDLFVVPDYSQGRVHVVIPKFKIETTIKFIPILQKLGVQEAFSVGADFKGIIVDEDVFISEVLQKSYVEVTETGVTAAAATFVGMGYRSGPPSSVPWEFVADHPFIFYITVDNVVMFVGRYTGVQES